MENTEKEYNIIIYVDVPNQRIVTSTTEKAERIKDNNCELISVTCTTDGKEDILNIKDLIPIRYVRSISEQDALIHHYIMGGVTAHPNWLPNSDRLRGPQEITETIFSADDLIITPTGAVGAVLGYTVKNSKPYLMIAMEGEIKYIDEEITMPVIANMVPEKSRIYCSTISNLDRKIIDSTLPSIIIMKEMLRDFEVKYSNLYTVLSGRTGKNTIEEIKNARETGSLYKRDKITYNKKVNDWDKLIGLHMKAGYEFNMYNNNKLNNEIKLEEVKNSKTKDKPINLFPNSEDMLSKSNQYSNIEEDHKINQVTEVIQISDSINKQINVNKINSKKKAKDDKKTNIKLVSTTKNENSIEKEIEDKDYLRNKKAFINMYLLGTKENLTIKQMKKDVNTDINRLDTKSKQKRKLKSLQARLGDINLKSLIDFYQDSLTELQNDIVWSNKNSRNLLIEFINENKINFEEIALNEISMRKKKEQEDKSKLAKGTKININNKIPITEKKSKRRKKNKKKNKINIGSRRDLERETRDIIYEALEEDIFQDDQDIINMKEIHTQDENKTNINKDNVPQNNKYIEDDVELLESDIHQMKEIENETKIIDFTQIPTFDKSKIKSYEEFELKPSIKITTSQKDSFLFDGENIFKIDENEYETYLKNMRKEVSKLWLNSKYKKDKKGMEVVLTDENGKTTITDYKKYKKYMKQLGMIVTDNIVSEKNVSNYMGSIRELCSNFVLNEDIKKLIQQDEVLTIQINNYSSIMPIPLKEELRWVKSIINEGYKDIFKTIKSDVVTVDKEEYIIKVILRKIDETYKTDQRENSLYMINNLSNFNVKYKLKDIKASSYYSSRKLITEDYFEDEIIKDLEYKVNEILNKIRKEDPENNTDNEIIKLDKNLNKLIRILGEQDMILLCNAKGEYTANEPKIDYGNKDIESIIMGIEDGEIANEDLNNENTKVKTNMNMIFTPKGVIFSNNKDIITTDSYSNFIDDLKEKGYTEISLHPVYISNKSKTYPKLTPIQIKAIIDTHKTLSNDTKNVLKRIGEIKSGNVYVLNNEEVIVKDTDKEVKDNKRYKEFNNKVNILTSTGEKQINQNMLPIKTEYNIIFEGIKINQIETILNNTKNNKEILYNKKKVEVTDEKERNKSKLENNVFITESIVETMGETIDEIYFDILQQMVDKKNNK